jgi:exosortase
MKRQVVFEELRYSPGPGLGMAALGTAILLAGAPLAAGGSQADRLAVTTLALVVALVGGFVLFYGTCAAGRALFPLAFLAFAIPLPTALLDLTVEALRRGSAELAYVIFKLSGTPVYREGYVFALPGLTIEVAPECSGIRSGIGMFLTSLLAGYLMLETWWRRALLIAACVPLLILKNAIRIDTLSLLSIHVDPGFIEGRLHHEGGIVFFTIGLLLLYPVLMLLVRAETGSMGARHRAARAA